MSIGDRLSEMKASGEGEQIVKANRAAAPTGWEPGLTMAGEAGVLVTEPVKAAPDWAELLSIWDLDPKLYEVVEPVQYRAWDSAIGGGEVTRLFYYRATIRLRSASKANLDEMLASLGKRRPKVTPARDTAMASLIAVGDTQLGDGETADVIHRFEDMTARAIDRVKTDRKRGLVGDQIVLPWLGDCIQGVLSQNGALAWRNDLTLVEMIRVYRRLALWQVRQFADVGEVRVIAIPGNHDQPQRQGNVPTSPANDSWAVEGIVMVQDALELAGGFDHVTFVYPTHDHSTVTLDVQGTTVAMAHGHQWRGAASGIHKWWSGQSHGRTSLGGADILLTGHRHHFFAEVAGGDRLAVVCPPLVTTGAYWTEATGDNTPPGMVTMRIGGGSWSGLEIL